MANSFYQGFIRGGHAEAGPELEDPNAINTTRGIYIVQNAAHTADCVSQPRVQHIAADSGDYWTPDKDWLANTWYVLHREEWKASMRADGFPYPLRVRIGGARSAGAGTVTFAAVVTSMIRRGDDEIEILGVNVITATTTSAVHAWLDGTASGTLLTVPRATAAESVSSVRVRDAVGGIDVDTQWCWLRCELWAKSSSTASTPQCSGYHVHETIGALALSE